MKRVLSVLLALCLIVGAVPMFASAADSDFVIEDGVLKKYNGQGGEVVIPDGVTSIGDEAFKNCTGLTGVTLPDSVTSIGEQAFWGCTGLTSFAIPSSVTRVGAHAFRACTELTSVTIPESVTSLGQYAFCGCDKLTSVTIPKSVTKLEDALFYGCLKLTSVTFLGIITSVDDHAFSGCWELTSLTFPEGLKTIGDHAFNECYKMATLTLPSSLTSIATAAFISSGVKDIYYGGTEEQWKKVKIGGSNDTLDSVTIHYKGGDNPDPTVGGFKDVKKDDFFADAVLWAVENDITAGTSKNTFSPNAPCRREQIMTFLWKNAGRDEPASMATFTDMPKNETFKKAISWAVEKGITSGTSKTTFSPGRTCTRAEAMTFIWKSKGGPEPNKIADFRDMPKNETFKKAISWAAENGITSGVGDGLFGANRPCTRGQIVTFLYKAGQ